MSFGKREGAMDVVSLLLESYCNPSGCERVTEGKGVKYACTERESTGILFDFHPEAGKGCRAAIVDGKGGTITRQGFTEDIA